MSYTPSHGLTLPLFRVHCNYLYTRLKAALGYSKETRRALVSFMFNDLSTRHQPRETGVRELLLLMEQDNRVDMLRIVVAIDHSSDRHGDLLQSIEKAVGISSRLRQAFADTPPSKMPMDLSKYARKPAPENYVPGITTKHGMTFEMVRTRLPAIWEKLQLVARDADAAEVLVTYFLGHQVGSAAETDARQSKDLLSDLEAQGLGDALHLVLALRRAERGRLGMELLAGLGLARHQPLLFQARDCYKIPTEDLSPLATAN